ncbi:M56 family metallopeptidase [Dyadobacter sp. CY323]|uniref:M56 family metallopeptidase n=1 Tax=Dyadobacter sp. CY323 TaxID=2907302 RepID=UPI001F2B8617|nr:M56 family metallopeptidase [Dyadobacter sp. CY323]MCE6992341.1 M56 family metallopeptidase [Dyadobacter sp. CY323]
MLFLYLLKVSLLLAVLTLGYRWMVQFETFSKFNRVLLWLNVIAAWSFPVIPMPGWGPVKIQTEFHQTIPKIAAAAPAVKHQISAYNPAPNVINSQNLHTLNISEIMLLIYLAGVAILSIYFLFQVGRLIWILAASSVEKSDSKVIFVRNKHIKSPFSFFRWIVINPENHTPRELSHIVAHETGHVLQWHSLDLMISEIQRIALWFNPFAWFHQKLVQANLEYLADRGVLESGCEKKQYQYSLLNAILQSNELPMTNSFAQSLLKKRIKMMNRKPSHYFAWGKYALLIGILYFSSAFVAPYTIKAIRFTPPAIRPAISQLVVPAAEDQTLTPSKAFKKEKTKENQRPISTTNAAGNDPVNRNAPARSKWVVEKPGTLYWAISPLAKWEDISEVMTEIKAFGGEMTVNAIEYDPLQLFITSAVVRVRITNGSSGQSEGGPDKFAPIKGVSGYITKAGGLSMGHLPPDPIQTNLEKDYQKAVQLSHEKAGEYQEYKLTKVINDGSYGSASTYLKESLDGEKGKAVLKKAGIGKSAENTLLVDATHKFAEFQVNWELSSFSEANAIPFDQIDRVTILKDHRRAKEYVIIYTK